MSMSKNIEYGQYIKRVIGEAALYEQLAEECAELAHAALKKARKLRGENQTPLADTEINDQLIEEFTDLILVSDILSMEPSQKILAYKLQRWAHRNGFTED